MKTHNVQQGTPEWLALRAGYFTASEASSMMGVSKYQTRSDLLKKKSTGIADDIDDNTQRLFDRGHATEATARVIAEAIIGQDLYPATVTDDSDYLLASLDGMTMDDSIIFEHKLLNAELVSDVKAGKCPERHYWQVVQCLLVSGAEKCMFAVSDGTEENFHYVWVTLDLDDVTKLMAGWVQFEQDLAAYAPSEVKEMPKAEVTIDLPALFVHARGEITTHNMDEFGTALAANLAETRAIVLVTDQDFSNAKAAAKKFRDTAKAIAISKEQMLAQTETIGEAASKMDAWAKDLNATALQLEKDVEREDKSKKESMVIAGKNAYMEHVAALEARVSPIRLNLSMPNFAEAIKGKRNYTSMQDAIDTELANAKIAANEYTDKIDANLKHFNIVASDCRALFADLQTLVTKPADDFSAVVKMRIQEHAAAEQAKADALRERIRAEEQAKAQADAEENVRAETAAREAQEAKLVADDAARKAAEGIVTSTTESDLTIPEMIEVAAKMPDLPQERVAEVMKSLPQAHTNKAHEPIRPSADYLIGVIAREFDVSRRQSRDWLATTNFNESEVA